MPLGEPAETIEGQVGHVLHTVQGARPGPPPIGPCQQRQHHLMHSRERQVRFGLHYYRAHHPRPAVGRVLTRRLEQRRLADTWLTRTANARSRSGARSTTLKRVSSSAVRPIRRGVANKVKVIAPASVAFLLRLYARALTTRKPGPAAEDGARFVPSKSFFNMPNGRKTVHALQGPRIVCRVLESRDTGAARTGGPGQGLGPFTGATGLP